MKKTFRIFHSDLKTVYTNIIALIVVIGIAILPALYSWFNIASNWDPYSSTGNVPFAVCNLDKGFSYQGIEVNAGNEIVAALKGNPKMGWDFVDEAAAKEGVENGTYYAAVIIPEEFSEDLSSITTGEFQESALDYYVNEKKNAIAPKITNAGITTIESEVKTAYVNTVTKILATTLNVTAEELGGRKEDVLNKILESLTEAQSSIDDFNTTADVFISTLNLLKQILETSKTALPSVNDTLNKAGVITSDIQQALVSAKSFSVSVSESLDEVVSSVEDMQNSVSRRIETASAQIKTDTASAADELAGIADINRRIININNTLIRTIKNLQSYIIFDTTDILSRIETANEHQQDMISKIGAAGELIRETGTIPETALNEIIQLSNTCKAEINAVRTSFQPLRTALNNAIDDTYSSLDDVVSMLQSVSDKKPDAEKLLDNTGSTIDEMIKTFENVKAMMESSKNKLENLKKSAESVFSDNEISDLLMKIISDPTALSDFFSQPVSTVTHSIHPVENYGAGMAPFYTSLGIWVGSIVLCAVIRAELTENQKKKLGKPNEAQQFFGRYLTFFVLAELQALIISCGDLYFLGIQCNNQFLFILGCMISAFVYSLIVYSLTITFNVIGKALAVIILVLQVAGSGGTFPIEVLPAPFQAIAPFLPFYYGNDILREAIAGVNMSVYWHNVLMLLVFVPFALLLGLLIRLPIIRFMNFLDRRIHESELII